MKQFVIARRRAAKQSQQNRDRRALHLEHHAVQGFGPAMTLQDIQG
jgi:hypothetical protein